MDAELSMTSDVTGQKADLAPVFQAFAAAGFHAVHWCHDWIGEPVFYGADYARQVLELAQKHSIRVADLHGFHGTDNTTITFTPELFLAINLNRAEFASAVGAKVLVLHLPARRRRTAQEALEQGRQLLRALRAEVQRLALRVAVENLPWPVHSFDFFDALLEEFPPDYLGMCYDSGHAAMSGQDGLLDRYAGRIIATHLHDNDGRTDQHRLPGQGVVNWPKVLGGLKRAGYRGTYNLELHLDPQMELRDYCIQARDVLTKLLEEPR